MRVSIKFDLPGKKVECLGCSKMRPAKVMTGPWDLDDLGEAMLCPGCVLKLKADTPGEDRYLGKDR